MAQEGMWKSAVNSSYNAGYFAALAALRAIGENPKTHAGLQDHFKKSIIATGKVSAICGDAIEALFGAKAKASSPDSDLWTPDAVNALLESAGLLVSAVGQMQPLNKAGN